MKIKAIVMTLAVVLGTMTSNHAADDEVDQAEIERLDALIESFNHFFDEQLRLHREQEILDAESRLLLPESEEAHRDLVGEDEATTNGCCDPGTLCPSDCNTANTLCMGNATTIADKCRDAVNTHHNCGRASFVCKGLRANDLSYCADQFLNNMLQCNSYASEQCMNLLLRDPHCRL